MTALRDVDCSIACGPVAGRGFAQVARPPEEAVQKFGKQAPMERTGHPGRTGYGLRHARRLALGGRPAAGFAKRLMLPVSKDTLLRVVRRRSRPPADPLRVIGIDDWAWRRKHRYASIICNLESAGWSPCCRTVSPRPPRPGSLHIPRSRSSPVTAVEIWRSRNKGPAARGTGRRSLAFDGERQSGLPRCGPKIDAPDPQRNWSNYDRSRVANSCGASPI